MSLMVLHVWLLKLFTLTRGCRVEHLEITILNYLTSENNVAILTSQPKMLDLFY